MALPSAILRYTFVFMYIEGIDDVIFYPSDEFYFPLNKTDFLFYQFLGWF